MSDLRQTIRWVFDVSGATTAMQGVQRNAASLQKQFGGLAKMAMGAFAVSGITSYANEAVTLAGKVEGVSLAFNKLGRAGLLDDLNKATMGTVSNLELMQKSVMAINLGIDKNQLPLYFEFATKRAQETGESVDFLVDSIVRGVGRQSALILDNLGISALALSDELEKGGTYAEAVGRIIQTEMAKSGLAIETAATSQAQLNKTLEDTKTELGANLAPAFQGILEIVNNIAKGVNHMLKTDMQNTMEGNRAMFEYIVKDSKDWAEVINRTNKAIERAYLRIADTQAKRDGAGSKAAKDVFNKELGLEMAGITELNKLLSNYQIEQQNVKVATNDAAMSVATYKDLIAALTKELDTQVSNNAYRTITARIEKYQAALDRLTNTENARRKLSVAEIKPPKMPGFNTDAPTQQITEPLPGLSGESLYIEEKQFKIWRDEMDKTAAAAEQMASNINNAITDAAIGFVAGMSTMIGAAMVGQGSFADFGKFVLGAFADMLAQLGMIALQTGIAVEAIKKALMTLSGVGAVIAGVALLALSGAVRAGVSKIGTGGGGGGMPNASIAANGTGGVPHMAAGGIVSAPTLALIGEGRESEAVIPLSKLNGMLQNNGNINATVKMRGLDMYLMLNRVTNRQNRFK